MVVSLQRLVENVVELNALTIEAVGLRLFSSEHAADLLFPAAENDASFAASHAAAYHFIVDGLKKDALERSSAWPRALASKATSRATGPSRP